MRGHEETQLRALFDSWARAIRDRDVDGMVAQYAPGVVSFDVVDPLRYTGIASLRQRAQAWLDSFDGPIDYELRDLTVYAADGVAFCHSLNRVGALRKDGQRID